MAIYLTYRLFCLLSAAFERSYGDQSFWYDHSVMI